MILVGKILYLKHKEKPLPKLRFASREGKDHFPHLLVNNYYKSGVYRFFYLSTIVFIMSLSSWLSILLVFCHAHYIQIFANFRFSLSILFFVLLYVDLVTNSVTVIGLHFYSGENLRFRFDFRLCPEFDTDDVTKRSLPF